jgi:CheY-like chemotaxis protein
MVYAQRAIPLQLPYSMVSPLNVLLVEDSKSDAAYMRIMLDRTHIAYALEHIDKGRDVVPYLLKSRGFYNEAMPDLILLDLGLPGKDGFEVLSDLTLLSCNIRSIPIVIITEYENFAYIKNTHDLYIFDYITKPCEAGKLSKILMNALRCRNY